MFREVFHTRNDVLTPVVIQFNAICIKFKSNKRMGVCSNFELNFRPICAISKSLPESLASATPMVELSSNGN